MEKKTDLRIIKTKIALKDAFLDLLKNNNYHNITISAISEKALVNRKTFYAHYETKEDLYNDVITDALAVLSPAKILNNIGEIENENKKKEFMYEVLTRLKTKNHMLTVLFSDNADGVFQQRLREQISQVIISKKDVAKNLEGTPYDTDVLCNIYFNTFFCVLKPWIESDTSDPTQPIELMRNIFSKEYLRFLGL